MRLLVTGGLGFIGSNYVNYVLKNHEHDAVCILDKLTYAGDFDNIEKELFNPTRCSWYKEDINNKQIVDHLVGWCDAVVHFAAESHVDNSIKGAEEFIKTNIQGTLTLIEAATKHKKRFHHVSTDEVYGSLGMNDEPFNEETPYDPKNPYSASKAASDHLVRAFVNTHGLDATITNCSNNYGPRQHKEKMIPASLDRLLRGEKIRLYGEGENVRDWLYVDDHCEAIDLVLREGRTGETYCIGGDNELSNKELVQQLLDATGKNWTDVERVTDRPGHDLRYAMNHDKITRELGWVPRTSFEEGLAKTLAWYRR